MRFKIGDRVKTNITDNEGTVIATDDILDEEYSKVKVRFDSLFVPTTWEYESMLSRIITKQ